MITTNILGKQIQGNASKILLANGIGGFFLYSPSLFSKYCGLYFHEGDELYKTIENLQPLGSEVKALKSEGNCFTAIYENGAVTHTLPLGKNALIIDSTLNVPLQLVLDCRAAYDMQVWGRYYEITEEDGMLVIHYSKKNDEREPAGKEYDLYIAVAGDSLQYLKTDQWSEANYPFDNNRKDASSRGVYSAAGIQSKKFVIASSSIKSEAIRCAKEVFSQYEHIGKVSGEPSTIIPLNEMDKETSAAYEFSTRALRSFHATISSGEGLYAGIPWFFQFWTRDTAISSYALSLIGDKTFAKRLLLGLLSQLRPDGVIPSRYPYTPLDSIDGTGWVLYRLWQLINEGEVFLEGEMFLIRQRLEQALQGLIGQHGKEGFLIAKANETWMDTNGREGACIELQALVLSMFGFAQSLGERMKDENLISYGRHGENVLKSKVEQAFYQKGFLLDRLDDDTVRPNIFLVYYLYPNLLDQRQWESAFDKVMEACWLPWGGFSTIDTGTSRFSEFHTGTNNRSYHNGDSWYFLNNLAALVLHRLNKQKYAYRIAAIKKASTKEILHSGIFGYHAELSSAASLESNGCLAQAWSSAMFIEMMHEIYS